MGEEKRKRWRFSLRELLVFVSVLTLLIYLETSYPFEFKILNSPIMPGYQYGGNQEPILCFYATTQSDTIIRVNISWNNFHRIRVVLRTDGKKKATMKFRSSLFSDYTYRTNEIVLMLPNEEQARLCNEELERLKNALDEKLRGVAELSPATTK